MTGVATDGAQSHDRDSVDAIIAHLHVTQAQSLAEYKRAALTRGIRRRMAIAGARSYREYLAYLEAYPAERELLFDVVFVNATSFFRNPELWVTLAETVAAIVQSLPPDRPFRAWSAGCATGEEAYSLAILCAAILGPKESRQRVKIYATDVDLGALERARRGIFGEAALRTLPPEHRETYFVRTGDDFTVTPELRKLVVFGRHDLLASAPIPQLDLVLCRNTLIYFAEEAQTRFLKRLHASMNDGAFLVLGSSELLTAQQAALFRPVDPAHPLFARRVGHAPDGGPKMRHTPTAPAKTEAPRTSDADLCRAAIDASAVARVLVEPSRRIAFVNRRAMDLLGLTRHDIGEPFGRLEVVRGALSLHDAVERAFARGRRQRLLIERSDAPGPEPRRLEATVVPLRGTGGDVVGLELRFNLPRARPPRVR